MFRLLVLVAASLAIPLVSAQETVQPAPPGVDLSGVWKLNYELSDEPRRSAPRGLGQRPVDPRNRRDRYGSGWNRWDAGGGYRRDREVSSADVDRLRRAVSDQLTAPRRMVITQTEDEVLFEYDDGRYVRVVPDGRRHAGIAGTSQVTRTVTWQGRALVADIRIDDGYRVQHTFEPGVSDRRLVVITVLPPSGFHDEVRLVRVYDAPES